MSQTFEAIYENGVFRPLKAPDLSEGQVVQLVVSAKPEITSAKERISRFRGILHNPNSKRSLAEELIQERRQEAIHE